MTTIKEIDEKYSDLILTEGVSLEKCTDFLSFLESTIPAFFSKNGEADSIHRMYDYLSDGSDIKLECVDVRTGSQIYTEYMAGMTQFINEIKGCSSFNEDKMQDIELKMENASANDGIFVDSIFGGATNAKKEITIVEASDNIEYLIDFIPEIKRLKDDVTAITEAVELTPKVSDNHEKLLTESLNMLYKSVANYCKDNIINIFETYHDIMDKIDNPVVDSPSEFVLV